MCPPYVFVVRSTWLAVYRRHDAPLPTARTGQSLPPWGRVGEGVLKPVSGPWLVACGSTTTRQRRRASNGTSHIPPPTSYNPFITYRLPRTTYNYLSHLLHPTSYIPSNNPLRPAATSPGGGGKKIRGPQLTVRGLRLVVCSRQNAAFARKREERGRPRSESYKTANQDKTAVQAPNFCSLPAWASKSGSTLVPCRSPRAPLAASSSVKRVAASLRR